MAPRQRFIVLVDFSPYAERLVRFAYDWSTRTDAELLLLHSAVVVAPVLAPHESRAELAAVATREAGERLRQVAAAHLPQGARVSWAVTPHRLVPHLRALLREPFAHLVFVGLKGTGALKRLFIGSEAVKVIDGVADPVVAVPLHADCCATDAVHVAVQRSHPLNVVDFNRLLAFTGDQIRKITFFSVVAPDEDFFAAERYLADLAALYADGRETGHRIYRSAAALEQLRGVISGVGRQFIVVQRGSRMLVDRISRTFLVNELVYRGEIPLIVLS